MLPNRGQTQRGYRGAMMLSSRAHGAGRGGAGIEIPESAAAELRPGGIDRESPVTIELMAPTLWDPLVLSGKIAWLKRSAQGRATRAGVRFEHREPSALYALFQLL